MPDPGTEADDEGQDDPSQGPRHDPKLWWGRVRWLFAVIGEGAELITDNKAAALTAFAARAAVVIGDTIFRS